MKITGINVYQVDLPLSEGNYQWANGKSVSIFDSTVVEIITDSSLSGWGETCPLGPVYLPAYATGCRSGIQHIGPFLIGHDPCQLQKINAAMDQALQGHPYAKSAIDMACWDLLGKTVDQPIHVLLGGRMGEEIPLYRAISQDKPEEMAKQVTLYREEGYQRFQLKVGGDPQTDIIRLSCVLKCLESDEILVADANTGWLTHEALIVLKEINEMDIYLEQPCKTYEECLKIRQSTKLPFILDESIHDLQTLIRGIQDRALDVVNIKISKFGGLSKSRIIRDVCVELGIAMTIEDSWGGDIVTAAIAHLAHSTPEKLRFSSTDFNSYVTKRIANGAPERSGSTMKASLAPGLGITPIPNSLGEPIIRIS